MLLTKANEQQCNHSKKERGVMVSYNKLKTEVGIFITIFLMMKSFIKTMMFSL